MASISLGQFNGLNTSYGAYNVYLQYGTVSRNETTITITNVKVYYEQYSAGWTTNRLATTGNVGNGQNAWSNYTLNSYGTNSPDTITHNLGTITVTGVGYLTSSISFNVQAKGTGGSTSWSNTSGTVQLNYTGSITVPVINKSTVTATNADIEASTSININRYSTSHTHTLRYDFLGLTGTIATGVATSYGWTIPSTFYAKIPNALSGTCTIYCDTYNGATLIGTNSCTFTATVNQTTNKPDISATITDSNTTTSTLTGDNSKFVKYFSNAQFSITATAKNSATISSRSIVCGAKSSSSSSGTLSAVESATFVVSTTDSRGLTNSVTYTKTLIDYVPLTFNPTPYRTAPTNKTIALTFNGNYFNDTFGNVANQLGDDSGQYRIYWKSREKGSASWGNENTINVTRSGNTYNHGASPITLGTNFEYTKAYEFSFRVLDKLTTLSVPIQTVSQGLPMFSAKLTGMTVNGDLTVQSGKKINIGTSNIFDLIYPVGSIYMSVSSTNPGTLFGGTWVAWGAGKVPVGIDANQTEFDTVEETGGTKTHTLTVDEIPSHRHSATNFLAGTTLRAQAASGSATYDPNSQYAYVGYEGGGLAHNNLQPYIVCYMFKRTA